MLSLPETSRALSPHQAEVARVKSHLRRAEQLAVAQQPLHLSQQQRLVRALLLDELARYRKRGRFPVLRDGAEQAPCFVDAAGTRCALAHLLEVGGEAELVQRIASERNRARVRELADEPRLRAWLSAVGLTLNEATSLQPEYCASDADSVVAAQLGSKPVDAANVVLEGSISAVLDGIAHVYVSEAHGDPQSSYVGTTLSAHILSDEPLRAGAVVLIPVSTRESSLPSGIVLSSQAKYGSSEAPASTQCLDAFRMSDALEAIGKSWGRRRSTGFECAPGAERATPNTLSVLLTLVSTLTAKSRPTCD